jgi:hypothetical protein
MPASATAGSTITCSSVVAEAPEGALFTYEWSVTDGVGAIVTTKSVDENKAIEFVAAYASDYTVALNTKNEKTGLTSYTLRNITVTEPGTQQLNNPPIINFTACVDNCATETNILSLKQNANGKYQYATSSSKSYVIDASQSTDPDGDLLQFNWTIENVTKGGITNTNSTEKSVAFNLAVGTTSKIRLTLSDSKAATSAEFIFQAIEIKLPQSSPQTASPKQAPTSQNVQIKIEAPKTETYTPKEDENKIDTKSGMGGVILPKDKLKTIPADNLIGAQNLFKVKNGTAIIKVLNIATQPNSIYAFQCCDSVCTDATKKKLCKWNLAKKPEGSTTSTSIPLEGLSSGFHTDVAGEYAIELKFYCYATGDKLDDPQVLQTLLADTAQMTVEVKF